MMSPMATATTTDAILDAAERLFAAHGYDAVSVREITRDAEVNVAAVHYHFGSKEAVLRGVTAGSSCSMRWWRHTRSRASCISSRPS
jgi:AcrR family transcriptional regulator